MMTDMDDEVEVIVAHKERATLRVGVESSGRLPFELCTLRRCHHGRARVWMNWLHASRASANGSSPIASFLPM
jgi:hypothetical protein